MAGVPPSAILKLTASVSLLRRLLLLPLLAPLLATLAIGGINPRPLVSLRLLTWNSPELPLGAWIAAAAATGAAVSGGSAALALRQGSTSLRRKVRRGPAATASGFDDEAEPWIGRSERQRRVRREQREEESPAWQQAPPMAAWPARAAGEPAPTVSVPFRVVSRPEGARAQPSARVVEELREPVPIGLDDWATGPGEEW